MANHEELPAGYRQAVATAITVFLGFSITSLRIFWDIEPSRDWESVKMAAEVFVAAGILIQVYSLFRALSLADNSTTRYGQTVRIFILGIIIVILGVTISAFFRS